MATDKKQSVEELLRDLGKKIDELIERGKGKSEGFGKEMDSRLEELRKNKEKLEQDFKRFTGDNEKWKSVEESLEKAAYEIKQVLKTAFGKKKKE